MPGRYSPSWGRYWEVSDLVSCQEKDIPSRSILFTEATRKWCQLPYPGHPHGCPNYGKNPLCPPAAPYRADIPDKFSNFKVIWAKFDFNRYKELVKEAHPGWTDRQITNVLYWQSAVKKVLRQWLFGRYVYTRHGITADVILGAGSGFGNCQSMESAGIDVFTTLRNNDIPIDRRPVDVINLVSLIAWNDKKEAPASNGQKSLLDFFGHEKKGKI